MASAVSRAYNGGWGQSPQWGFRGLWGQGSPGSCSGSDLTEATRQRRTFDTAAILSLGLNDSLNGADVSHLEVLCDFLQVQSLDRCIAFWFSVA